MTPPASSEPPATDEARRAARSLLGFWADAGVDAALADAPVDRLAATPARTSADPTAPARTVEPPSRPIHAANADATASLESAVARASAATDLAALVEAAAAFAAAAHGRAAPPSLLIHGSAAPLVAWVTEAPDAEDEAAGRPFAGPAGRLLQRMTAAAGLEGRVLHLVASPRRGQPGAGPDVAAATLHAPFLERALELAAPLALVLAGSGALRAVTGSDEPILKAHGRLRPWTGAHFGVALPVLPTFAPAALLGQPVLKARAWRDILTLLARIDSPVSGP